MNLRTPWTVVLPLLLFGNCLAQGGFSNVGAKKYANVYAVVVGISNYSEIKDLTYADKDAKLMYDLLALRYPESKANFQLLTNENATQGNIKKHIYNACKVATDKDLVILYFSGHGDVMSVYGTDYGYFLAHDASKSREYESGGAVEFEFINRHVNGAASTKKCDVWLITDACRAGKVINENGAKATMNTLNQSFLQTTKLISCQANELSYEDSTINQGVFTYFLLKGMSGEADSDEDKSNITIDELNNYLRTSVRKHTNSKQTPKATSSDEFKPFFTPMPSLANLIKKDNGAGMDDLAARGKGVGDETRKANAIESAIAGNNLRENANSAYSLYKQSEKEYSASEAENIREKIAEALSQRGQRLINKYLSGKPLMGDENFESAQTDFQIAFELLGKDHYLADEFYEKMEFTACLQIIAKEDFAQYPTTEQRLLKLIAANPLAAYLNIGLSQLYYKMAKSDKAQQQSKIAHEKVSTWSKPQNLTAFIYIENGQIKEAQDVVDESVANSTSDGATKILQSKIKLSNLEMQLAEKELAKIQLQKDDVSATEYALLAGEIETKKGRITYAEAIYKKALVADAENEKLLLRLAELYQNDGDTTSAIRFYDKILKIEPSNKMALLQTNALKNQSGNLANINLYETKAVLRYVDYYLSRNETDKAIDLLKQAQKINPFDPDIDYAFAKIYYQQKEWKEAEKQLKQAIQKSPYHFESIRSLTFLYILQKDFDKAKTTLVQYAPNFKYSSKWRVFTYEAFSKMEKKNNQLFILEEALNLDSTDTEAYKALFRFHMDEGRFNAAEKEYRKMKKLGSRMKDSTEFVSELIQEVEKRVNIGQKDNRVVEGLKMILKYDKYYLARMIGNAENLYMETNYRDADIYLEQFAKYLFCMQKEDRIAYLKLKAKLMLEVGMYQQSLDLFRQLNEQSYETSYLGVAMAQYELGMKEDVWMANFSRDQNTKGYNRMAIERYRKMSKNKGYYPSGYK